MRFLICKRENQKMHSTSWFKPWLSFLESNHLDYTIIDPFILDSLDFLRDFDCLLWHINNYSFEEMLEGRNFIYAAKSMGLKVFPDFEDAWHFDDKIAETYALKAINAPIPKSWIFYDLKSVLNSLSNNDISFPVIAKLRTGSGSHNVKMIKNREQLLHYSRRMFNKGFNPSPSFFYKASSNIRSSHNSTVFLSKFKRIPEFMRTLKSAKKFPNERGYVFLQEFIPNDNFDLKIVVVNNKLTGLYRPTRTHDFRASGGGEIHYDKSLISKDIISSAFLTAKKLGARCIGFDYVVNNKNGKGYIIEMSYGFSHTAIFGSGGWYDEEATWHEGGLNAPEEIIKSML